MDCTPGSGTYVLCPVCFWEDDQIQFEDPDYGGGANKVSLNEARNNFREFRASERQFVHKVRAPREDEMPTSQ